MRRDGNTFPINASLGKYGLAFDNADQLWTNLGNNPSQFGSTDMETGVSTITATHDGNVVYSGGITLAGNSSNTGRHGTFDPETNLYWALVNDTISKYDMTTGAVIDTLALVDAPAFPIGPQASQGLRSLAFASPVPVPPAVWLFGSGLIGLVSFSKRHHT